MDPERARGGRGLALRPLPVLVVAVLLLNVAGWAVDASPLRQEDDSWGYAIAAFFLSLYAVPVLVVAAVCALLALAVDNPREQAFCAWVSSGACALAAVLLAVLALPTIPDSPAAAAFGLAAVADAVVLMTPLVACVRRVRAHPSG